MPSQWTPIAFSAGSAAVVQRWLIVSGRLASRPPPSPLPPTSMMPSTATRNRPAQIRKNCTISVKIALIRPPRVM